MQTILVTGGTGFIGSHTCVNLLLKGYRVIILDSYENSSKLILKKLRLLIQKIDSNLLGNLSFHKGDIRDKEILEKIFYLAKVNNNPIKGVIHFAGLKAVGESVTDPLRYWDFNFIGTLRLLESMEKFDCRTIIFSSSATIYGYPKTSFLRENNEIKPFNPYGYTKASIEILLKNVFESKPNLWRIANLRYFNPIGAHESGLLGEDQKGNPDNIFPFITKVAAKKIDKLSIFGKDWETEDGTGVRDYIHVMDLAEGHILSLEFLLQNKSRIINLNIGTGTGTSVLQLVNTFKEVNKIDLPYIFAKRRPGDVPRLVADNSLACSLLNWKPKKSIEDMCRDGWRWQLNNLN
tara:strand:- start:12383 stop:13429 length:1047 start_codon:yes stop_codon:yes gene_type:complete